LSVDPITKQYPELTPYQFASNTPIQAIDLDGLEAFIIHGTQQTKTGISLSPEIKRELLRISGNSVSDDGFRWDAPINNTMPWRITAARELAIYVRKQRAFMIKNGDISENEPVSLIGYSHGGNVADMAIAILNDQFGLKANLITISTPAYNSMFNVDYDAFAIGNPQDPQGNDGIFNHVHMVHENDRVVDVLAGGSHSYSNPKTKNYLITDKDISLKGGIDAHTEIYKQKAFGEYLKKIRSMEKAPAPKNLDLYNKMIDNKLDN
jgi:hypothetical protein